MGGTALYDAIARALPVAAAGRHKKKAVLVISDGNDTSSSISVQLLRQRIRDSEVLVYALGVDGTVRTESTRRQQPPIGLPIPNPFPPPRPRGRIPGLPPPIIGGGSGGPWSRPNGERVNPEALREVTDDTGGRTEIVRGFGDLQAATARLADELSKQVLAGLFEHRGQGRPLASDPRGSARPAAHRPRPARLHGLFVTTGPAQLAWAAS